MKKVTTTFLALTIFSHALLAGPQESHPAAAYKMVKSAHSRGNSTEIVFNTVLFGGVTAGGFWLQRATKGMFNTEELAGVELVAGMGGYILIAIGVIGLYLTYAWSAEAGTIEDYYANHLSEYFQLPEDQAIAMIQSREGMNLRKKVFEIERALIETEVVSMKNMQR